MEARRSIRLTLFFVVLVSLSACNQQSSNAKSSTDAKLKVATTFTVIADMAQNVAGDAATVVSITKPGAEIHNYQLTPQDIVAASDAKLVLWNGMGLELWFEKFLQQLSNVPSATVTEGITPIPIGKGPYAGKPNPHAWMSPADALIYVDNIAKAMSSVDEKNAGIYSANAEVYKKEILAIANPVKEKLMQLPVDQRWLASSEGAFSYLARDFNLNELYLWPINADQQGSPAQVKHVIDTISTQNIKVIFSESTVSPKPAKQIAKETGIHYGGVLYVDSLSKADGPVPTYLDLIRVTTNTLINGITESGK